MSNIECSISNVEVKKDPTTEYSESRTSLRGNAIRTVFRLKPLHDQYLRHICLVGNMGLEKGREEHVARATRKSDSGRGPSATIFAVVLMPSRRATGGTMWICPTSASGGNGGVFCANIAVRCCLDRLADVSAESREEENFGLKGTTEC